jgi:hypothetical protein
MTVAISIAALAVSLSTFMTTRWRDKRDLLLRVHERLITPDQQHGRRLIYGKVARGIPPETLDEDERTAINNALTTLDAVAIYYRRRYIRRKDLLELWALTVVRLVRAAEPFLAHRNELLGTDSLPSLQAFAGDAEQYLARKGTPIKAIDPRASGSPPDPDIF